MMESNQLSSDYAKEMMMDESKFENHIELYVYRALFEVGLERVEEGWDVKELHEWLSQRVEWLGSQERSDAIAKAREFLR